MEFLSEDPTYLAGGLGLLAVALLIALRVTQQGRYLIWALVALGLAAVVLVIEHFWVTDAERIERVVYDLRDAVLASDAERVLTYLTPDVQFVQGGHDDLGRGDAGLHPLDPVEREVRLRADQPPGGRGLPPVAPGDRRVPDHRQRQPAVAAGAAQLRHDQLRLVARAPRDQPRGLEGEPDHPDPLPTSCPALQFRLKTPGRTGGAGTRNGRRD